jgi:hypothetical protein
MKYFGGLPVWTIVIAASMTCFAVGCDLGTYSARTQETIDPNIANSVVAAPEPEEKKKARPQPKLNVTGKWELDFEATKVECLAKLPGQGVDAAKTISNLQEMVLEFDLESDGSFTCEESAMGQDNEIEGNWVLNGNKIRLNQTHNNGAEERDQLTGTVEGKTMNLVKKQDKVSLPIMLRRIE